MPLTTDYIRLLWMEGATSDMGQSCHQWVTLPVENYSPTCLGWTLQSTREGQGGAGRGCA